MCRPYLPYCVAKRGRVGEQQESRCPKLYELYHCRVHLSRIFCDYLTLGGQMGYAVGTSTRLSLSRICAHCHVAGTRLLSVSCLALFVL